MKNSQETLNRNLQITTKSETFFVSDSLKDLVSPEDLSEKSKILEETEVPKFDFVSYSKEKSCLILKVGETTGETILKNWNNPDFSLKVSLWGKVFDLSTDTLEILREKNFYYITLRVRSIL